jgi:hypothetical protein
MFLAVLVGIAPRLTILAMGGGPARLFAAVVCEEGPIFRVAYLGVVALSLTVFSPAWGQDQEPGTGELPPPPPDLPIFSGKPVTSPFEATAVQPSASRVMFEGAGPENTRIVIREMLIGPGAHMRLDALPGPALVDLRSGAGTLRVGDRSEQLQIARAISVEPGFPIELTNNGGGSLLLRLYLVETR